MADGLGWTVTEAFEKVKESTYSKVFIWENLLGDPRNIWKHVICGIVVTIDMTVLDQDLMQKNLSMETIMEAQTNLMTFTGIFLVINFFFLAVGALLYFYADANGINIADLGKSDYLYPEIALRHLSIVPGIIFMMGLTAATFATTDSALTALTTSYCVDFLNFNKKENPNDPKLVKQRNYVHFAFSIVMLLVILLFHVINDESVVSAIFKIAGYTYGPLLGLFSFGILTKMRVKDNLVPYICVVSPILMYLLTTYLLPMTEYKIGFELIVYNGLTTFILLWLTSPGKVRKPMTAVK